METNVWKRKTKEERQKETKLEAKKMTSLMKAKNMDILADENTDHLNILEGPDIWICDSGCNTHMNPHKQGFDEIKYGEDMNMSGCIVGKTVNCDGIQGMKVAINNVRYTPGGKYNMLSERVLKKEGWLLFRDNKSKWLEKNGRKIIFDIKVETSEGLLYCMKIDRTNISGALRDSIMESNTKEMTYAEIAKNIVRKCPIPKTSSRVTHVNQGQAKKVRIKNKAPHLLKRKVDGPVIGKDNGLVKGKVNGLVKGSLMNKNEDLIRKGTAHLVKERNDEASKIKVESQINGTDSEITNR